MAESTNTPGGSGSAPIGTTTAGVAAPASEEAEAEWLRAETAKAPDKVRQARLLGEAGERAERAGDEPTAARDYLAAFNAAPDFREPLEALVRLLERRRSLKNLGRVIDALVRAALTPAEKARALVMRAAYLEDVGGDVDAARVAAEEALDAATAQEPHAPEAATAALTLELVAAKLGDAELRSKALQERANRTSNDTWRGLLLLDLARIAADGGDVERALSLAKQARELGGGSTFAAALAEERIAKAHPGIAGSDEAKARSVAYGAALESQGALLAEAVGKPERGDELGVPRWARERAHVADAFLRAAEVRRLAGEPTAAAAVVDRAIESLGEEGEADPLVGPALVNARMRLAELVGDTALAASLAERRLARETDGATIAALCMRVAELASSTGDATKALAALGQAVKGDPASLPARALQLDMLADTGQNAAFAEQLESFSDRYSDDAARARAFLLSAFVWAIREGDVAAAKGALSQASMSGVPHGTVARVARAFALVRGDAAWVDEATRRLIASGADAAELPQLWFELARSRLARDDIEGAKKALAELAALPGGAWLGRMLESFLPLGDSPGGSPPDALLALASQESNPETARALRIVAALRAHVGNDDARAMEILRERLTEQQDDVLVATFLADLERKAGDLAAAARVVEACAAATDDAELATALALEAGLLRWGTGDRRAAVEQFTLAAERGAGASARAAKMVVGWASRAIDPDSAEGRRVAIERARDGGGDARVLDLERLATELSFGDLHSAEEVLTSLEKEPEGGAFAVAAALARLLWPTGAADPVASDTALDVLAMHGAAEFAASERMNVAREGDADVRMQAARTWLEAGGGPAAALEWLTATVGSGNTAEEVAARRALAEALPGEAREALASSAALLDRVRVEEPSAVPLLDGDGVASRLANLELSPPGTDPRRRATALCNLGDVLGEEPQVDAMGLGGWSLLLAGDLDGAIEVFSAVTQARPDDIGAWEGLRASAEAAGQQEIHAQAAQELGGRCGQPKRAAAFLEEAAHLWLALGQEDAAEAAFDASFTRDPTRGSAFDRLFRRVRDRKDGDRLLALITRRLEATDDPPEVAKLFWEQARVLREKGDSDGALTALENVTMIEPDHVGALALTGEISIRRGKFADAAEKLSHLASLDQAPPKNRVTAGVAAVDLYENKLDQPARALEVLLLLHKAQLSTLPVRERLAKAAAKTGSWEEATSILETLMTERPERDGRIDAARLAMAIYRDKLHAKPRAAAAVKKLLDEAPGDAEAIDLALEIEIDGKRAVVERARATLLAELQQNPGDANAAERLSRVARALGDRGLEDGAVSVAVALGARHPGIDEALSRLRTRQARSAPATAFTPQMLAAVLAKGDEGPVAALFGMLGATLGEALGPTRDGLGVGRRDRVDARSGVAIYNEHAAWAGAFGLGEVQLYVGGKDPNGVQGIAGEDPALVVGPGIRAPFDAATRAKFARELFALSRGTTVLRSRDETSIAAIVVAACRIAEVKIEAPPYAMLAEVEKLISKAIARKTRNGMRDVCNVIAQQSPDPKMFARAALLSQARVAVIAAGELAPVLIDLVPPAMPGDPRTQALVRLVLSPAFVDVRRSLGLEAAS